MVAAVPHRRRRRRRPPSSSHRQQPAELLREPPLLFDFKDRKADRKRGGIDDLTTGLWWKDAWWAKGKGHAGNKTHEENEEHRDGRGKGQDGRTQKTGGVPQIIILNRTGSDLKNFSNTD